MPTVLATAVASAGLLALGAGSPASAAAFTEGDVVVLRVGDGAGGLTGAAAPLFLDEYTPGGTLVQSVPLPTTTESVTLPVRGSMATTQLAQRAELPLMEA